MKSGSSNWLVEFPCQAGIILSAVYFGVITNGALNYCSRAWGGNCHQAQHEHGAKFQQQTSLEASRSGANMAPSRRTFYHQLSNGGETTAVYA